MQGSAGCALMMRCRRRWEKNTAGYDGEKLFERHSERASYGSLGYTANFWARDVLEESEDRTRRQHVKKAGAVNPHRHGCPAHSVCCVIGKERSIYLSDLLMSERKHMLCASLVYLIRCVQRAMRVHSCSAARWFQKTPQTSHNA